MNRIRETRKEKNVKQMTLAAACGVSQCTFSNWESGRFNPDIVSMGIISDMLGVSIDYLLCREDLPAQPEKPDQLSDIEFALSGEIHDLTDEEKQDILDYVRFKRSQRKSK